MSPLRDYRCQACKEVFEAFVSRGEESHLQECPNCGKKESDLLPPMVGYYQITGNNSASTRPRGGAFKRGKNG